MIDQPKERRLNSMPWTRNPLELAVRILRYLYVAGGERRLKLLKRETHAYRCPGWQNAYTALVRLGAIKEDWVLVNNQGVCMVKFVQVPEGKDWKTLWENYWHPTLRVKPKKNPLKRGPRTEWMERMLAGGFAELKAQDYD